MEAIHATSSVFLIFLTIAGIALLISMVFMVRAIIKYYHLKGTVIQRESERKDLEEDNKNKTVEYSNNLLELIQMIVSRIAVLRFRHFMDTHRIDPNEEGGVKVNRAQIVKLIEEIAKMANDSLKRDNFNFDDTFFTEDFYNKYIVGTTEILVKEMLAKIVDNYEEYFM